MAEIRNQAKISFDYSTITGAEALSNIALAELRGPLVGGKNAVQTSYQLSKPIDYVLELTNNGATTLSGVRISDNLGRYTFPAGSGSTVVPLSYVTGTAYYLLDGLYQNTIAPATTDPLAFNVGNLASGSTVTICFKATLTQYAPLAVGSTIRNTTTFTATGIAEPVTDTHTITVGEYADVTIFKAMTPNPVMDNGTITYTFTLTNSGNSDAENIELDDKFTPIPSLTSARVGTFAVDLATDVIFDAATGDFSLRSHDSGAPIVLPAASIAQSPTTGVVTVTPSTIAITIIATI